MQVCPNQRLRTFRGTIKRQSRTIFKMDKSFIFFVKLPTVLRLKIWHQALLLFPGILEARPLSPSQATSKTLAWTIIPTKNLTLLSINQESRYELAKFYATPFEPTAIFPTSDISLRINYAVDILFVDTTELSCMWGRIHTFTEFLEHIWRLTPRRSARASISRGKWRSVGLDWSEEAHFSAKIIWELHQHRKTYCCL